MNQLNDTLIKYDYLTPTEFYLSQNYPNPFSEKTVIKFCVPYCTRLRLKIFNEEGKLIKELLDEEKQAGSYEVEIDASDLINGNYFYRIEAGDYIKRKEMILLR